VNTAVCRRSGQQPLVDLRHRAVVGVDDVGDRRQRDLREELVRVEPIQAVQLAQPRDHLDLTGSPRFFQRTTRTHAHQVGIGLQARPRRATATLDQVDDRGDVHCALDGRAARLAFTLTVVAVAQREQRSRHVDPQITRCARSHLRGVHVATEHVGHQ
jgi:hypothetical protein